MSGYQETLTDPSYDRQVVVATAPHIGNTGWNDADDESEPDLGGRVRRPRRRPGPVQLAGPAQPGGRAARPGDRRDARRGHPRADPAPARARRHAGRRVQRRDRSGEAARPGCSTSRPCTAPTWPTRSAPPRRTSFPPQRQKSVHGGRAGSRHQVDDAVPDGRAGDRGPRPAGDRELRRDRRARARRGVLLQRPGRPGGRRRRGRRAARGARGRHCRSSGSASATSCSVAHSASGPTSWATATAASTSR